MHKSWVNFHEIYLLLYALKPAWPTTCRVGHMYSSSVSQVQRLHSALPIALQQDHKDLIQYKL